MRNDDFREVEYFFADEPMNLIESYFYEEQEGSLQMQKRSMQ